MPATSSAPRSRERRLGRLPPEVGILLGVARPRRLTGYSAWAWPRIVPSGSIAIAFVELVPTSTPTSAVMAGRRRASFG